MEYGKYIIKKVRDKEVAILFDSFISHCDIDTKGDSSGENISAGFFQTWGSSTEKDKEKISVSAWGKSITLKLKSRSIDSKIILKLLKNSGIILELLKNSKKDKGCSIRT